MDIDLFLGKDIVPRPLIDLHSSYRLNFATGGLQLDATIRNDGDGVERRESCECFIF